MLIKRLVVALAAVVASTTFVLLFGGLFDLALEIGLHRWQAWLFPISIDGLTLAALVATLDHRVKGVHLTYAWVVVVMGTAVSTFSQFLLHAQDRVPGTPDWTAPVIASFPALGLAMVWHLLWVIAKESVSEVERAQKAAMTEDVLARLTGGAPQGTLEKAIEVLEVAQATGERVTGSKMAQALGLLKENGSPHYSVGLKWLKKAEEAMDTHA